MSRQSHVDLLHDDDFFSIRDTSNAAQVVVVVVKAAVSCSGIFYSLYMMSSYAKTVTCNEL